MQSVVDEKEWQEIAREYSNKGAVGDLVVAAAVNFSETVEGSDDEFNRELFDSALDHLEFTYGDHYSTQLVLETLTLLLGTWGRNEELSECLTKLEKEILLSSVEGRLAKMESDQ